MIFDLNADRQRWSLVLRGHWTQGEASSSSFSPQGEKLWTSQLGPCPAILPNSTQPKAQTHVDLALFCPFGPVGLILVLTLWPRPLQRNQDPTTLPPRIAAQGLHLILRTPCAPKSDGKTALPPLSQLSARLPDTSSICLPSSCSASQPNRRSLIRSLSNPCQRQPSKVLQQLGRPYTHLTPILNCGGPHRIKRRIQLQALLDSVQLPALADTSLLTLRFDSTNLARLRPRGIQREVKRQALMEFAQITTLADTRSLLHRYGRSDIG
ncbi:Hypothetical predicted protein [Pelobates cultripes]|uniref:Uncharacterized protein n=1 Tax=Pelobates cultripes TaxID=61616 RepID=A0AAD1RER0_PELCU|nr:Hypothetical predicted protein [Pelobates cultripes]